MRGSLRAAGVKAFAAQLPVLIVGGGPVGLFTSLLLSRYGVSSLLVERHERGGDAALEHSDAAASASHAHPRAHVLNARTMELLRSLGLDAAVAEAAPPFDQWRRWRYCDSLLGRDLGVVDFFDDVDGCARNLEAHSPGDAPGRVLHLAQPHIEDVLRREALRWRAGGDRGDGSASFRYSNECVGLTEDDEAVCVELRDVTSGARETIACSHVIACDGVNSVARSASGIASSGDDGLEHFLSFHFTCPALGPLLRDRPAMLYFVFNPSVIAVLVAHDLDAGVWVAHVPFFPPLQKAADFDDAHFRTVLSACVGADVDARGGGGGASAADLDFELHSMRPWTMRSEVADEFSSRSGAGRVHLLGDAAHQFPPSGGFGVNTGLHDAHNIAWKVACVERGDAPRSLLRSYAEERRPVALATAALSVRNYRRGLKPASALGLEREQLSVITGALASAPLEALLPLWLRKTALDAVMHVGRSAHLGISAMDRTPFGRGRVDALRRVVEGREALPLLFPRHDLGTEYSTSGAIVTGSVRAGGGSSSDGGATHTSADEGWSDDALYVPTARPGARFPHVAIVPDVDDGGGAPRSTHDLLVNEGAPRLLAVADATTAMGRAFARAFAARAAGAEGVGGELSTPLDVALHRGPPGGALGSRGNGEGDGELSSAVGFRAAPAAAQLLFDGGKSSAVLVRPDGYVSWRDGESAAGDAVSVDAAVSAAIRTTLGTRC